MRKSGKEDTPIQSMETWRVVGKEKNRGYGEPSSSGTMEFLVANNMYDVLQ